MITFPPVRSGDEIRVSASAFTAFVNCPERAAAHFRGEFGPDTRAAFSGGLAHRVFARHLDQGPIDGHEFEQVCREEIGGSNLNYKVAALGLKPSSLGNVIEEVGHLYERFKLLSTEGFEAAEVFIESAPAEGVSLVGRVDAVFGGPEGTRLIDWKTGAMGEVERQLDFYAMLWALDRHELPGRVEAISVSTGERYSSVPSLGDVEASAELVSDMITSLREGWAEGTPAERRGGPWCRFCPVLEGCTEGAAAVEVTP